MSAAPDLRAAPEGGGRGGSKARANLVRSPCEVKPMGFTQLYSRAFMCVKSQP